MVHLRIASLGIMSIGVLMTSAFAEDGGFYVRASLEQVSIDEVTDDGVLFDDNTIGYMLGGGYQFNRYFSVEGGYNDFGDLEETLTENGVTASASVDANGFYAAAIGKVPLGQNFALTGKAGLLKWDADILVQIPTLPDMRDSDDDTDPFFGIGGEYYFSETFTIAGGYDRFKLDNVDLDVFNLGVIVRF